MSVPTPFRHDTFMESANRFHGRDLLSDPTPRVVVCLPDAPALVLGSVQRSFIVADGAAARRGVDVMRRRSGGGAVLVEPDGMVWFDVVVPADDSRFADVAGDVRKSMQWMGTQIRVALEHLGVDDVAIHDGPMVCTGWCRLVCFAGIGPGEVVHGDRKLVGISQRRTRAGSRFQCAVHTRWNPELLVSLLVPPRPGAAELPDVATLDERVARALPGAMVAVLNAL
jgi:lipoate-protein ligase A